MFIYESDTWSLKWRMYCSLVCNTALSVTNLNKNLIDVTRHDDKYGLYKDRRIYTWASTHTFICQDNFILFSLWSLSGNTAWDEISSCARSAERKQDVTEGIGNSYISLGRVSESINMSDFIDIWSKHTVCSVTTKTQIINTTLREFS